MWCSDVDPYLIHKYPPTLQTQDELATLKFDLKQKELALSQSRSHVEELMRKQDRQNTEAAMKKGSDEHRIRGLQEQLDLKIRELLAVSH